MIAPVNIVIAILEDIGLNINIRPHIIDKIEVIIVSIHTGSSIFFKEIDNLSLKILIHINQIPSAIGIIILSMFGYSIIKIPNTKDNIPVGKKSIKKIFLISAPITIKYNPFTTKNIASKVDNTLIEFSG